MKINSYAILLLVTLNEPISRINVRVYTKCTDRGGSDELVNLAIALDAVYKGFTREGVLVVLKQLNQKCTLKIRCIIIR